jgi:hypothetical protein
MEFGRNLMLEALVQNTNKFPSVRFETVKLKSGAGQFSSSMGFLGTIKFLETHVKLFMPKGINTQRSDNKFPLLVDV